MATTGQDSPTVMIGDDCRTLDDIRATYHRARWQRCERHDLMRDVDGFGPEPSDHHLSLS